MRTVTFGILTACNFLLYCLGGLDALLIWLAVAMVLDVFTGIGVGIFINPFSIKKMFLGGFKKASILGVIIFCTFADKGLNTEIWRTLAVMYYIAEEGLSFLRNVDILDVPVPKKLKDFMANLRDQNDTAEQKK